ncbi:MAG: hypothetical protein HYW48_07100 [Deltaproteobacteria bacterium]|nr:hypothetical protein [Deltaproteobacteria bacterium]
MKKLLFSLWIFQFASLLNAATVSSVTAELEGDYESIFLSITISDAKATESTSTVEAELYKHVAIRLPSSGDDTNPIQFGTPSSKLSEKINDYFYWEGVSAKASDPDANGVRTLTIEARVKANTTIASPKTLSGIKESDGSIKLEVGFKKVADATAATFKPFVTKIIIGGPNAAPSSFTVSADDKSLIVTWTKEDITYTDGTNKRTPSRVLIMVFNTGAGNPSLKAYAGKKENNDTREVSCKYNSGSEDCIDCSGLTVEGETFVFLDADGAQYQGNSDIQFWAAKSNNGFFRIPELTPNVEYTTVLQYEKGSTRTKCKTEKPIETFSLAELNGGQEGKLGDPRCFVVSAAYGSSLAKEVDTFRWARDRFLLTSSWGPKFVDWYYDHSQPLADAIKEFPVLQMIFRALLWPVAGLLNLLRYFLS